MENSTAKVSKVNLFSILFADGKKIVGTWIEGKQQGFGYYEFPDGKKVRGVWKEGQLDPKSEHIDIGFYDT